MALVRTVATALPRSVRSTAYSGMSFGFIFSPEWKLPETLRASLQFTVGPEARRNGTRSSRCPPRRVIGDASRCRWTSSKAAERSRSVGFKCHHGRRRDFHSLFKRLW